LMDTFLEGAATLADDLAAVLVAFLAGVFKSCLLAQQFKPGAGGACTMLVSRNPVHLHGLAFVRPSGMAPEKWEASQAGHCSD
jgi:hypothetical protein